MRTLLICCFISLASCCTAQLYKASLITKVEERHYKLIEMKNGDLVPFVKLASDNKDHYLEDGKTIKTIHLGIAETDTTGFTDYFYYGDSIVVTKEYDKNGLCKEKDSSYRVNGLLKRHLKYTYRSYKTNVLDEEYFILDSLNAREVTKETGEPDKELLIIQLGKDRFVNVVSSAGEELRRDTVTVYKWGNRIRKSVVNSNQHVTRYTRYEYSLDENENWTSKMMFYNKDSIGDHIECVLRKIYYKGKENAEPKGKEAYYGYWVSLYGYHTFLLKQNGVAELWRSPNKESRTTKWVFDQQSNMPYIILTGRELKDLPENVEQGNRMYLHYDKKKKQLKIGDFDCTYRPVLKRQRE